MAQKGGGVCLESAAQLRIQKTGDHYPSKTMTFTSHQTRQITVMLYILLMKHTLMYMLEDPAAAHLALLNALFKSCLRPQHWTTNLASSV